MGKRGTKISSREQLKVAINVLNLAGEDRKANHSFFDYCDRFTRLAKDLKKLRPEDPTQDVEVPLSRRQNRLTRKASDFVLDNAATLTNQVVCEELRDLPEGTSREDTLAVRDYFHTAVRQFVADTQNLKLALDGEGQTAPTSSNPNSGSVPTQLVGQS